MELFFLKLLDVILGTVKGIFVHKNKILLSAIASSIATYFYLSMMVKLVKVNSLSGMMLICFATFLGTYIPMIIAQRVEKDKVYVYNVTPDTNENGKDFADAIREKNIPILTFKGYNKSMELVLCCEIFSTNKEQSKAIEEMIPESFKYHVIETKNSIAA